MKKVLILAGAAALMIGLTACGNSVGTNPKETVSAAASMAESGAEDSLLGLCEYMKGNGILTGAPREMLADLIGAKEGYRYEFNFNDSVVNVELYEFDLNGVQGDTLSTAKEVIAMVQKDGHLPVMGTEVNAVMSKNGRFLMMYTDKNTDQEHVAQEQKAKELFVNFKADSTAPSTPSSSTGSQVDSSTSAPSDASSAPEPTESTASVPEPSSAPQE